MIPSYTPPKSDPSPRPTAAPAPLNQPRMEGQANRFRESLAAAGQRNSEAKSDDRRSSRTDEVAESSVSDKESRADEASSDNQSNRTRRKGDSDRDSGTSGDDSRFSDALTRQDGLVAPGAITATDSVQAASLRGHDPAFLAQVERMAAAIAEMAHRGSSAEMTIQFPASWGLADGAVLGRNVAGALMVRIVGVNPAYMHGPMINRLAHSLKNGLEQRKVRVGEVAVSGIGGRSAQSDG